MLCLDCFRPISSLLLCYFTPRGSHALYGMLLRECICFIILFIIERTRKLDCYKKCIVKNIIMRPINVDLCVSMHSYAYA